MKLNLILIVLLTAICFIITAGVGQAKETEKYFKNVHRKWVFKNEDPGKSITVRDMTVKKDYNGKITAYKGASVSYLLILRENYNRETRIIGTTECYWEKGKKEFNSTYKHVFECDSSGNCEWDRTQRFDESLSGVIGSTNTVKFNKVICEKLVPQIESGSYVGSVKERYSKMFDAYLKSGKKSDIALQNIYKMDVLSEEQIDTAISLNYELNDLFWEQGAWMTAEQDCEVRKKLGKQCMKSQR